MNQFTTALAARIFYTALFVAGAVWAFALFEYAWLNPELTQMQVFTSPLVALGEMHVVSLSVVVVGSSWFGWRASKS